MKHPPEHPLASDLGPELEFLRRLWALDHALQSRSAAMARQIGVTGPQRLVLRLVGRFPGVLAGSLARLLHLDPSTVAGIVARLEKGGLIVRQTDAADRRRQRLVITSGGATVLSVPGETVEGATTRALRAHSSAEVASAMKLLAAIESYLAGSYLPAASAGGRRKPERILSKAGESGPSPPPRGGSRKA